MKQVSLHKCPEQMSKQIAPLTPEDSTEVQME